MLHRPAENGNAAVLETMLACGFTPDARDKDNVTPLHRAALKGPNAGHTALTNVFTGRPARGIVNRIVRELGPINATAPAFPLATSTMAVLRSKSESRGSGEFSPLWCGQNHLACREVPAGERTRQLAGV